MPSELGRVMGNHSTHGAMRVSEGVILGHLASPADLVLTRWHNLANGLTLSEPCHHEAMRHEFLPR